ncbi:helix-turn-helix transcriptional regulator [Tepidamorphus sp. 3E244]|uniref:helix-turn-helix transcriptional regulator n=1 Tax=Tepidamorphus sp. 3E244 TaxID=3385498 RepID=UPI0038FCDB26
MKAARALLGWTQSDLADEAGLGVVTIRRIEASGDTSNTGIRTLELIIQAFNRHNVKFVSTNSKEGVELLIVSSSPDL